MWPVWVWFDVKTSAYLSLQPKRLRIWHSDIHYCVSVRLLGVVASLMCYLWLIKGTFGRICQRLFVDKLAWWLANPERRYLTTWECDSTMLCVSRITVAKKHPEHHDTLKKYLVLVCMFFFLKSPVCPEVKIPCRIRTPGMNSTKMVSFFCSRSRRQP